MDLPSLHDSIDPDAIDQLFERQSGDADSTGGILCFTVNGWNVFVRDDGRIRVCDPTGPADPSPVFD